MWKKETFDLLVNENTTSSPSPSCLHCGNFLVIKVCDVDQVAGESLGTRGNESITHHFFQRHPPSSSLSGIPEIDKGLRISMDFSNNISRGESETDKVDCLHFATSISSSHVYTLYIYILPRKRGTEAGCLHKSLFGLGIWPAGSYKSMVYFATI